MNNSKSKYTLQEALKNLSSEQKGYYDALVDYADSKPRAEIKEKVHYVKIGVGNNPYVILYIKHNIVIANFKLESDEYLKAKYMLKSTATAPEYDMRITNEESLDSAKRLIDTRVEQMNKVKEIKRLVMNAKQRQDLLLC